MNTIVNTTESNAVSLQLPEVTENLIKASISENTQKTYQRVLHKLEVWLSGRSLSDELLAAYISEMHTDGKSPQRLGKPSLP